MIALPNVGFQSAAWQTLSSWQLLGLMPYVMGKEPTHYAGPRDERLQKLLLPIGAKHACKPAEAYGGCDSISADEGDT